MTFLEKLQKFMHTEQTWDGILDSEDSRFKHRLIIPSESLISVRHMPIPCSIGLMLETSPQAFGAPEPTTPPPFKLVFGSDKAPTTKLLHNGVYTFGAGTWEVSTVANIEFPDERLHLRAFSWIAFSPISLGAAVGL